MSNPLINLRTDLRSLKFSGAARENPTGREVRRKSPYIITPIPPKNSQGVDTVSDLDAIIAPEGKDYLLRQGVGLAVANDESRFFEYFRSTNGLNFIAKQEQLSRIGVKSQAAGLMNDGVYVPTNTLAQLAVNPLGGHLLKQGLNPTADTQYGSNLFGNGGDNFLDNLISGISNFEGVPAYVLVRDKVEGGEEAQGNRLVQLAQKKIYVAPDPANNRRNRGQIFGAVDSLVGGIVGGINSFVSNFTGDINNNISDASDELIRYDGGPQSFLGLAGQTGIRIARDYNDAKKRAYNRTSEFTPGQISKYFTLSSGEIAAIPRNTTAKTLPNFINSIYDNNKDDANKPLNPFNTYLAKSLPYETKNFENRVNLGNPGATTIDRSNYQTGGATVPIDQVNALQIYKSYANSGPTVNPVKNDFVKFRFGVVNTQNPNDINYVHFRAIIDSFSDNYGATWNPQNYMGRAESFYRYTQFDRTINISFTVAAQSRDELIPMYQKLNYLASTLAPDYTDKGYMAGNIVNMTIGGWCFEQPGFITSMTLDVPQESPWEIGIPLTDASTATGQSIEGDKDVKEMPHMVSVTGFSFTPIHNFVPKVQSIEFANDGTLTAFGDQRYIALENEGRVNSYQNPRRFNPSSFTPMSTLPAAKLPVNNPVTPVTGSSDTELSALANTSQGING